MSYIGPALPPNLKKSLDESDSDKESTEDTSAHTYGPALPTHLQNAKKEHSYGPALPTNSEKIPVNSNSEDEDDYGPLPIDAASKSLAHRALEERALQIKLGYLDTNASEIKAREEWMMELPEVGASKLGLGPRQFRKNAGPDMSDRSSWTDTPEQKVKKQGKKQESHTDLKKEAELKEIRKRDAQQANIAERHSSKKKRGKSLLEMHHDELKKKRTENADKGESSRRPFNREIDLKVNQFDDAQKRSIIKKAMHLDDRFSTGQSKFL